MEQQFKGEREKKSQTGITYLAKNSLEELSKDIFRQDGNICCQKNRTTRNTK